MRDPILTGVAAISEAYRAWRMRITFVGHSTVLIEIAGLRLLTDPLLRGRVGHLLRHAEPASPDVRRNLGAVLISHGHLDHLHGRSLRLIDRDVPVLCPKGLKRAISLSGFRTVYEIGAGQNLEFGAATITAVHAEHDARRHPLAGPAPALGYVIAGGEPREAVWFAGDTDLYDAMSALAEPPVGPIDVALLPVWGWGPSLGPGHLNPQGAAKAVRIVKPRVAIPIHWGTLFPAGMARLRGDVLSKPPREFARRVAKADCSSEVTVLSPGDSTVVTAIGGNMSGG